MPAKQDEHTTRTQRILKLYGLLLFTGRRFFLADLARELRCSKQTVQGMVDQMQRSHAAEIETGLENRKRWYRIKAPRTRPHIALSPEDIRFLLLCRDFVAHLLPPSVSEHLDETVRKTTALLPDMAQREEALHPLGTVLLKGGIDYGPFESIIRTLTRAIQEKRVCEIRYRSLNATEAKTYHFAPMLLKAFRESLYAVGWRVDPRGINKIHEMHIPVHRFEGAETTRLRHNLTLEERLDCFGFPECEPFPVTVRFDASAGRYAAERRWSADQTVKELPDGGVELTFVSRSRSEVVSWVLSFGSHAELVAPGELRLQIFEEAKLLLTRHETTSKQEQKHVSRRNL
jgi:predicted DNA-binding transcriptional regulator YafY